MSSTVIARWSLGGGRAIILKRNSSRRVGRRARVGHFSDFSRSLGSTWNTKIKFKRKTEKALTTRVIVAQGQVDPSGARDFRRGGAEESSLFLDPYPPSSTTAAQRSMRHDCFV